MQKVTVNASRCYDILIGSELLPTLGAEAKKFPKVKTVCVPPPWCCCGKESAGGRL